MRVITKTVVAILMLAVTVQAQDVKQIVNELQTKPAFAPVSEPSLGITVSQPLPAEPKTVVPAGVAVEPSPAVVEKVEKKSSPEDKVETVAIASEMAGKDAMKGGLITLNIKEVELSNVIRLFASLSGANIIVPELEGVTGAAKVDVNLKDVEWKPALQAILDTRDLELYEKIPSSEVYSVRKKLPPTEAVKNTRTFIFKHADIAQALDMIKGIVGDRGQVTAYPQGNAIVVKTIQEIMDDIAQIAERIDTPRQQALIEARIMELSDDGSNERGVDLRWDKILNGVANPSAGNLVKDGVSSLKTDGIPTAFASPGITGIGTLTLNSADLGIMIKALQTKGNAQTISNPKVIVANGGTAKIDILTKIPKLQRKLTRVSDAGGTTSTIEVRQDDDGTDSDTKRKRYVEYEFGIKLAVTPTIYSEENIAVLINPIITRENTEKTIQTAIGKDDAGKDVIDTYYSIDEKRVNTTFMLGNKRTAVIGGLTETKDVERERKVPLLGSIPLIRQLFTHKYTQKIQTENIIFVTVSLEDGKNFDVNKAVKQSPLTRKQLVRDENNQVIDDSAVEAMKSREESRIKEETKMNARKEQATAHDHNFRKPFWSFLRP